MGKQSAAAAERKAKAAAMRAVRERQERRRTRMVTAAIAGVVVIFVGGVAAVVASSGRAASPPPGAIRGLQTYTGLARDHVTGKVSYPQTPPVGGAHSAVWQNCGIYSAPVANENAVHSLEHGAFWITYTPGIAAAQLAAIRSVVAGQSYALVSPYPGQPSPIEATAWGAQLQLTSASDPRLAAFVSHFASGTLAPEPRGECTGGTGSPTG